MISLSPKLVVRFGRGIVCGTVLLAALVSQSESGDFADAIHDYLESRVAAANAKGGIVVGLVDEHGRSVVSCGKLDNGTDQDVNGDTLFEIGSDTKTFTALLLQDMVARGQMKLDDPVAKYVPESVEMPTRNGRPITLRHLATHLSGLPGIPDNMSPKRADNPYSDFTVDELYAFLSNYQLRRDPGAESEYSNLGVGLLGHAIALKAGTSYELLTVDRICRPLEMDSTRIMLTPELRARFAAGHNEFGYAVASWDVPTLAGAGALRSTVNDLLKYLSANLGLTESDLTPTMEQTHKLGLAWFRARDPDGTEIIYHGGGTAGCHSFTGFDKSRRRGVAILSNSQGDVDLEDLGKFLLRCEWQAHAPPADSKSGGQRLESYVGRYDLTSDSTVRGFAVPKGAAYGLSGVLFAVLGLLVWRAGSVGKRATIFGLATVIGGGAATIAVLASRGNASPASESGIGIRFDGDRLFAETIGSRSWPVNALLPPGCGEIVFDSQESFVERISGNPMNFSRDAQGKATGFTAHYRGNTFVFDKVSDQSPESPSRPKPRVAIELEIHFLDACVGEYEFPPDAAVPTGFRLTVWREADQLVARADGPNVMQGTFEIFPETETNFFLKVDGAKLTFVKNKKGEVTSVVHQLAGYPSIKGKRVSAQPATPNEKPTAD